MKNHACGQASRDAENTVISDLSLPPCGGRISFSFLSFFWTGAHVAQASLQTRLRMNLNFQLYSFLLHKCWGYKWVPLLLLRDSMLGIEPLTLCILGKHSAS